jgi:hypothetical protein
MTLVADYVLRRLTEWGVRRVYGYPGDGIDGLLGAFDRAGGRPETIWWARHLKLRKGMRASPSGTPATTGPGTPYAIAARFAHPDRPVNAFVGDAWDEALAARLPVVPGPKVDDEIAPVPPHIMKEPGRKAAEAAVHDPEGPGIAAKGMRRKPTELVEHLPGRH